MTRTVRVGTRGSRLALIQTQLVVDALRVAAPQLQVVVETIRSLGDERADEPIASLGRGVFTSALERALHDGRIGLAVHSLKDLPPDGAPDIVTVPVLPREDPRDVLVDRWRLPFRDLPSRARIGTSSIRRVAQLRLGRKDLTYPSIRGSVETRAAKALGPDYDGTVLAAAGLLRLGLSSQIAQYFSAEACAPDPGQGALAAQVCANDPELLAMVQRLTHQATAAAVTAERWVLRAAGGGCAMPIGALATVDGDTLRLFATVTAPDGSASYRVEVTGPITDPDVAGREAWRRLQAQGADAFTGTGARS